MGLYLSALSSLVRPKKQNELTMAEFPNIQSKHSLVAKHVTKEKWDKLSGIVTKTSGFTLAKAIACAVEFDNQHCGMYAGDEDSYIDFADVFDPLICEYHGLPAGFKHVSNMNVEEIKGNVGSDVPVHSVRIRVGRSIQGFGLSPGITKDQRVGVENLMKGAFTKFTGDLAGNYYALTGQKAVVFSTMKLKHSLSGSMKRINSESSPCKRAVMSEVYSNDWQEALRLYKTPLRLNLARTSNCPTNSVIFTPAQPI